MKDTPSLSEKRKNEHIQICKTHMVESSGSHDWDQITLWPEAFPECDLNSIDTHQSFLNTRFSFPIFITGMTGGIKNGKEINNTIAKLAHKYNIPMGLGSQKMMLLNSEFSSFFDIKNTFSDIFLIGNIGAVSLNNGITPTHIIEKLIKPLKLNAFALHLNALQECIQPEGERNFSNLLKQIEQIVKQSPVPIIVKEVGSGINSRTLEKIIETGVSSVDVSGKGGTSWSVIEGLRSDENAQRLGELFRNWGFTTKHSLEDCINYTNKAKSNIELTATGGIRNGIHIAKAIALGAKMCGVGLPFFRAIVSPPQGMTPFEALENEFLFFIDSLKISMFCTGSKTVAELTGKYSQKGI